MQDPIQEMATLRTMLDRALVEHKARGKMLAQKERDYKVASAKRMLVLRAEGYPATLIPDLTRGDEEIAKLRMERDIAQTLYDTSREAINSYKLQIRIVQEQIKREWDNV